MQPYPHGPSHLSSCWVTHFIFVPLKASFKWTLVLVDQSEGVAKLVQDSGPVHKAKVHGE